MSTVTQEAQSKHILYPPGGILMWIIIYLELITFGAVLLAMVWCSKDEPEVFHQSRLHLNTLFLLVSGFFMALTVGA